MKKLVSILVLTMIVASLCIGSALAYSTDVTYDATTTEAYEVTVPATMTPGSSDTVSASGTWASNRKLTVTADSTVTLTNSINAANTKDLAITFDGIELAGSNTAAVSDSKTISIAEATSDMMFGTWSGTFNYTVTMNDAA